MHSEGLDSQRRHQTQPRPPQQPPYQHLRKYSIAIPNKEIAATVIHSRTVCAIFACPLGLDLLHAQPYYPDAMLIHHHHHHHHHPHHRWMMIMMLLDQRDCLRRYTIIECPQSYRHRPWSSWWRIKTTARRDGREDAGDVASTPSDDIL